MEFKTIITKYKVLHVHTKDENIAGSFHDKFALFKLKWEKKKEKKRVKDKHAVDRTTSNLPRKRSGWKKPSTVVHKIKAII